MRSNRFERPNIASVVIVMCLTLLVVSSARAQTTEWADRAFLNLNVTLQLTSRPFNETLAPVIYAERAVVSTTHPGEAGGLMIEPAGGVRLWHNFGAGATLTRQMATETSTVRALVPHPVLFNVPRVATKDVPFERSVLAVHAQALYMIPLHPRLDVAVSAGPTFFSVSQDLIRAIVVAEAGPPFAAVAIGEASVLTRKVSTVGLNAGVDVTWFLKPSIGIGATARYVRGYAGTTLEDGSPLDLDLGAFQVGVGARLRFR